MSASKLEDRNNQMKSARRTQAAFIVFVARIALARAPAPLLHWKGEDAEGFLRAMLAPRF